MSDVRFPPGPWTLEHDEELARFIIRLTPERGVYPAQRAPIEIDADYDPGPQFDEAEALARLLTAAPKLYAALERVEAAVRTFRYCFYCERPEDAGDSRRVFEHSATCWVPMVQEALAEARGEAVRP